MLPNEDEHETEHDLEDAFDPKEEKKEGPSALDVLPRLALAKAAGAESMALIEGDDGLCLVVGIPDVSWAAPISRCLLYVGRFHNRKVVKEKPRKPDDDSAFTYGRYIAEGIRVAGISQDPRTMLPPVLMAAADIFVDIPLADGAVLAETILQVTGDEVELPDDIAVDLDFDQLVACIRRGSTGKECVDRLATASARKTDVRGQVEGAVHVDDLVGYGDAQEWAQNLISDIEAWRRGEAEWEALDSRVLVHGLPGTGKTTLAKSVAFSAGIPIFATSASAWFLNGAGYLDSVIKQIDGVFAAARAQSPALVFIDELDSVPDRATISTRGRDWWLPVIVHLLTLIDGANESNKDLVIMGATNYPDRIDDALVRSGRLSRMIEIGLPTREDLAKILRQHLSDAIPGADLLPIADLMAGATGADAEEAVKRARSKARRARRPMVVEDLREILMPAEHRTAAALERISVHEAGHVVVGHVLGLGRLRSVSLLARGGAGGQALFDNEEMAPTREDVEHQVVRLLGGRAAEKVLLGSIGTGSGGILGSDLERATTLIAGMHASLGLAQNLAYRGDGQSVRDLIRYDPTLAAAVESDLRSLHDRAEEVVARNEHAIRVVAEELRRSRSLAGDDVRSILQQLEADDEQP